MTGDPQQIEYLYGREDCNLIDGPCRCEALESRARWDTHTVRFRITKKTAKRVYYAYRWSPFDGTPEEVRCVDRQELEADGEVYRRSGRWWEPDFPVYLRPLEPSSEWLEWYVASGKDAVSRLRAEMAAAHPDRGGTSRAFVEAHRRYLAAKGRAS
jgi:hypothetical protein